MPYATDIVKISEEEWEFITDDVELANGVDRILGLGAESFGSLLR